MVEPDRIVEGTDKCKKEGPSLCRGVKRLMSTTGEKFKIRPPRILKMN